MIALALAVGALWLLGMLAREPDERAPQDSSHTLDALLFVLCLLGIVAAARKPNEDDLD